MITLAKIQEAAQRGEFTVAQAQLREFLGGLFPINIASVEIRKDALSLNSVNGFINVVGGQRLFFKFHHEENEEAVTEYYNSQLLAENGFPVEMPLYVSKEVGKQVLIYPLVESARMADVCKVLDIAGKADAVVVKAQEELDKITLERYLATLHTATAADLQQEPINQLFYNRLVAGGRKESFYDGKNCELPNLSLNFDELQNLKWRINGLEYNQTLAQAFDVAKRILAPNAAGDYAAVVAHADAHNGNVWYNQNGSLTLFDPAFAGRNIPALLAEVKATFHNIFAHPLWLYDSAEAKFEVTAKRSGEFIEIEHNWQLGPLREEFLKSKQNLLWKPLLDKLGRPEGWEQYVRHALFCCPTLVMNLRAGAGNANNSHTPQTSALGFAISIMLSSPPTSGADVVSEFFKNIKA